MDRRREQRAALDRIDVESILDLGARDDLGARQPGMGRAQHTAVDVELRGPPVDHDASRQAEVNVDGRRRRLGPRHAQPEGDGAAKIDVGPDAGAVKRWRGERRRRKRESGRRQNPNQQRGGRALTEASRGCHSPTGSVSTPPLSAARR